MDSPERKCLTFLSNFCERSGLIPEAWNHIKQVHLNQIKAKEFVMELLILQQGDLFA